MAVLSGSLRSGQAVKAPANHCPHLVLFAHPNKTAMLLKLAPLRRLPTSKVFLFHVTVSCPRWNVNHLQCSKISEGSSRHQQLLRSPLFNDFTIMKNNNDVSNMRYGHVTCWNNCCATMTSLKCYIQLFNTLIKKRTLKGLYSRKQYHVIFSTTYEIIKPVSIIKMIGEKRHSCWMYDHTLWSHFIYKLSSLKQLLCRKRERRSHSLKSFCLRLEAVFHHNVKHVEVRQKELRSASHYESSQCLTSDKTLCFVSFFINTKVLQQRYHIKLVKINKRTNM